VGRFAAWCTVFIVVVAASAFSRADGGHTPRPGAKDAAEGRRLLAAGRFDDASRKLQAAWAAYGDPEALFDLAMSYERSGRDAEAIAAFRSYEKLPLALRARDAEDHVRVIEARNQRASVDNSRTHRVIVPVDGDMGDCFRACLTASACPPGRRCPPGQFACLQTCRGARVELGTCAGAELRANERCWTDRGRF
jgi:hypothetical protein